MRTNTRQGVSIIELLIAIGIFTASIVVMLSLLSQQIVPAIQNGKRLQTIYVAEEVFEALRFLRSEDWNNISTLTLDTDYVLEESGGSWVVSTTGNPEVLDGIERTFQVRAVYRDGSDNISETGSLDTNIRGVQVVVTWDTHTGTTTYELEGYIANIFD